MKAVLGSLSSVGQHTWDLHLNLHQQPSLPCHPTSVQIHLLYEHWASTPVLTSCHQQTVIIPSLSPWTPPTRFWPTTCLASTTWTPPSGNESCESGRSGSEKSGKGSWERGWNLALRWSPQSSMHCTQQLTPWSILPGTVHWLFPQRQDLTRLLPSTRVWTRWKERDLHWQARSYGLKWATLTDWQQREYTPSGWHRWQMTHWHGSRCSTSRLTITNTHTYIRIYTYISRILCIKVSPGTRGTSREQ